MNLTMKKLTSSQYLSQTDGNILGLLTDPRVSATAVGAVLGNVLEKQVFTNQRATFGKAVATADGGVKYVDASGVEQARFKTNRQLFYAALILGGVGVIEFVPEKTGGVMQYFAFGAAVVGAAHLFQSFFPTLR